MENMPESHDSRGQLGIEKRKSSLHRYIPPQKETSIMAVIDIMRTVEIAIYVLRKAALDSTGGIFLF